MFERFLGRGRPPARAVARFERVGSGTTSAAPLGPSPKDEEELELDEGPVDLDDGAAEEIELPRLDTEDAEATGQEAQYDDLIDHGWLERAAEVGLEEDGPGLDDIGLTIDLDGPTIDDDGARVVDLDIGSLLAPLPADVSERETESFGLERGDPALGVNALRDLLPPVSDDDAAPDRLDDREVGDDERFPVFDDAPEIAPAPAEDDEDAHHGDELS